MYSVHSDVENVDDNRGVFVEPPATYRRLMDRVNISSLNFPISVKEMKKYKELNPKIIVNVFGVEESIKEIFPVRVSKFVRKYHVDLLLIQDEALLRSSRTAADSTTSNSDYDLEEEEVTQRAFIITSLLAML